MKKLTVLLFVLLTCCEAWAATPVPKAPAAKAKPASIVVFDSILLGGFENGKWLSPTEAAPRIAGSENYSIYSFAKHLGNGVGSAVEIDEDTECEIVAIQADVPEGLALLALHDKTGKGKLTWNPVPRKATVLGRQNETYKKVVKDVLAQNGLSNASPQIMQIFRIDLEGDGVDEVVLYAQNGVDPKEYPNKWEPDQELLGETGLPFESKKDAYSLLLLRKIVGGKVRNIPLASFIYARDHEKWNIPLVHKIFQFADVNGDGIMEIITGSAYYEGLGYSVYAVKGGDVEAVLSNSMGH